MYRQHADKGHLYKMSDQDVNKRGISVVFNTAMTSQQTS